MSDLTLALGDVAVPRESLQAALDEASHGNRDERIFLRADKNVPYGELVEVMNRLRSTGFLKIALVGLSADQAR